MIKEFIPVSPVVFQEVQIVYPVTFGVFVSPDTGLFLDRMALHLLLIQFQDNIGKPAKCPEDHLMRNPETVLDSDAFLADAGKMGISLCDLDYVVLSHGAS